MGRPKIPIDSTQLEELMRLHPSLEDVAAFFKCSPDTIERHVRDAYDLSFAEFREQNMVHSRFSLIRTALKKAEKGDNVMLIFCLKNLCHWRDRPDDLSRQGELKPIMLAYRLDVPLPEDDSRGEVGS